MTTKTGRPPQRGKLQDLVKKGVSMAEEAGCQLRPMQSNPTVLRGLCPFHYATTMQNSNTLRLDTRRATFRCQFCHVEGTMVSFAALIWEMSIPEANQILNAAEAEAVSVKRPVPVCMQEPEKSQDPRFRAQNSHVLTKATQYYARKLAKSREALSFMSRLGITAAQTEMMKIGYADGSGPGLINTLQRDGVTGEEIEESTLVARDSKGRLTERYERVLVVPHLDTAGNTSWMMMMHPAAPDIDEQWQPRPSRPIDLWGRRPYMLGALSIRKSEPAIWITDDYRIYLVAKAQGIATLYTMGKRENDHYARMAQRITEKSPRHLTVACYDRDVSDGIADACQQGDAPVNAMRILEQGQILQILEPTERDNAVFAPPNQPAKRAATSPDEPETSPVGDPANEGVRS